MVLDQHETLLRLSKERLCLYVCVCVLLYNLIINTSSCNWDNKQKHRGARLGLTKETNHRISSFFLKNSWKQICPHLHLRPANVKPEIKANHWSYISICLTSWTHMKFSKRSPEDVFACSSWFSSILVLSSWSVVTNVRQQMMQCAVKAAFPPKVSEELFSRNTVSQRVVPLRSEDLEIS